jgi:hypothetical protein
MRGVKYEEYEASEPVRKAIAKAKDSELEGCWLTWPARKRAAIGAHMYDEVASDREDL